MFFIFFSVLLQILKSKSPQEVMGERRGTKALELWCRRMVEDYNVRIDNMTVSWRNGLAFCALVSKCLSLKGLPCDLMLVSFSRGRETCV